MLAGHLTRARIVRWFTVDTDPNTPLDVESTPELDALVLAMHDELALLDRLLFKLTVLRQLLLGGDARFVQWAAAEVDDATQAVLEHEPHTLAAIEAARHTLASTADRVADLAVLAPESHRRVLLRLSREIQTTSRALTAQRDAVRRQSTAGRQALDDVLDLTETNERGDGHAREPGQLFRGVI